MIEIKFENKILIVQDNVINVFKKFRQSKDNKNESGGILLGEVINETFIINKASIPNKFDKSSKYGFIRDKDIAQIIINYEFINSNSKCIYLGEWHTHPEKNPTPSNQDINMIKEQFSKNIINEKYLFLLIQGIDKLFISVYNGNKLITL